MATRVGMKPIETPEVKKEKPVETPEPKKKESQDKE